MVAKETNDGVKDRFTNPVEPEIDNPVPLVTVNFVTPVFWIVTFPPTVFALMPAPDPATDRTPLLESVIDPVAPVVVIPLLTAIAVTPVLFTTTAPVVGDTLMAVPPLTLETPDDAVELIVTIPVPPAGLRLMFVPATSCDTPLDPPPPPAGTGVQ